jgi:dTDP-4-dehydrorhamnose reductase
MGREILKGLCQMNSHKVLILGVNGMMGHNLFSEFAKHSDLDVYATVRSNDVVKKFIPFHPLKRIIKNIDAEYIESFSQVIKKLQPDIVINCIGIIKQLPEANNHIISININALFPHRLALLCKDHGVRMIHISTDCVFDGTKGNYSEDDLSDAQDLYGRTKYLGEVAYPHCITLRTSVIGHELTSGVGLVEWFLAQEKKVSGYTKAIYSGFPTVELARIIHDFVIPNPELSGLYHVSSEPISKYELLKLIAEKYDKTTDIEPYDDFVCDRSLDSTRFREKTGYEPPSWPELIEMMHSHFMKSGFYT